MPATVFTMRCTKIALLKYVIVSAFPSLCFVGINLLIARFGLYPDGEQIEYSAFNGGMILFVLFFTVLLASRKHLIVVHENHLTEKNNKGWHVCTVRASQISRYRRDIIGAITLFDTNNQKLLRVECDMTNFDLFEKWLTEHNIKPR